MPDSRHPQLTIRAARATVAARLVSSREPTDFRALRDTLRHRLGWTHAAATLALTDALSSGALAVDRDRGGAHLVTAGRAA